MDHHEFSESFSHPIPPCPAGAARRAVIDVGTNSIKLLVADVQRNSVLPIFEGSRQTRLGSGFYETRRLQPDAILNTAKAVAEFVALANHFQTSQTRVIATSAARDAINGPDLVSAIQQSANLPVEIISGDREADLAFQGVLTNPEFSSIPVLIIDVGGGSTEFVLGEKGRYCFSQSFSIGSVRLLERLKPSDPPTPVELARCREEIGSFLREQVAPMLSPLLNTVPPYESRIGNCPLTPALSPGGGEGEKNTPAAQLIGTGGTTTILARMHLKATDFQRDAMESLRLTRAEIQHQMDYLWSLPLAERMQLPGLPPKRADVILMGVGIYEAILQQFGFSEVRISTRGLRFGAVMEG